MPALIISAHRNIRRPFLSSSPGSVPPYYYHTFADWFEPRLGFVLLVTAPQYQM